MTDHVFAVLFGGSNPVPRRVIGVFAEWDDAVACWHHLASMCPVGEVPYYFERWPVGVPLQADGCYLWPAPPES